MSTSRKLTSGRIGTKDKVYRPKSFTMLAGSKRYYPNGQQEIARRLRQIAAGQLTAANGLWIAPKPRRNVRKRVAPKKA